MTGRGTWKVYFNRHQEAPRVWCIAPLSGLWELAVQHVTISAPLVSKYATLDKQASDHAGPPSAWFQVEGVLVLMGAEAVIHDGPQ